MTTDTRPLILTFAVLTAVSLNTFAIGGPQVPAITTQPVSAVVSVGQTASLSVANAGTMPIGYQWLKNGAILPGQTNATLTFAAFQFINSGNYSVVITNAQGMAISLPASLSVPNAPLKGWGYNGYGQLRNAWQSQTLPITLASNVVSMAAGDTHSLFVTADGTLWGMGGNFYGPGELGLGALYSTAIPLVVASNVVAVTAGTGNSFFIKTDGTLWGMGNNTQGSLGIGTFISTNLPTYVANNVVAVAVGQYQTLFVKADGTLWGMGYNGNGQLGIGTTVNPNLPTYVTNNVVAVAAGGQHSLFMKADGSAWGMGDNSVGQLGLGNNTTPQKLPVYVTNNVVSIAVGGSHSMFVKADGTLWNTGYNGNGELGNGTLINTNRLTYLANNVVTVIGGSRHSLFMKTDGSLWTMGWNYYGTLGNGTSGNTKYPNPAPVLGGLLAASLANNSGCLNYCCLAIAGAAPVAGALTNRTVWAGQPTSFTASVASGDGPFTYQWQKGGDNILNATNAVYSLASAALADAGSYAVLVYSTFGTTSTNAVLTVNKATPTVTTWPTAASITYGQTLASSTLSGGGASADGTFGWTTPSTAPGVGTALQGVTFTPTDTANYNIVSGTASVTVSKGAPGVTAWPTATSITYGQTLAASTLSGGTVSVTGSFGWTTPATAPGAGTALQGVTFTPTDTDNYNTDSGTASVTVNKAAQIITFGTLPVMVYGDAPFALTASASSGLTVSYDSSDTAVATVEGNTVSILKAGSTLLTASQAGDGNYLAATNVSQNLLVDELLNGLGIHMETNAAILTITGNPGREYAIRYSDTLTNTDWPVLTTIANLPSSPYSFTDPEPVLQTNRFYRLLRSIWSAPDN